MKQTPKIFAILPLLAIQAVFAQTPWDGTANTDWHDINPDATTFAISTAKPVV